MRTFLSNLLRVVVPAIAFVVIFGACSAYGQSPRPPQYRPTLPVVHRSFDHPEAGGSESMSYSRGENSGVVRALDQARAALQASPARYNDAERAYRFAIAADPYDTRAYFGLGFIFDAQKRYAEAIQAYRKAVNAQPNSPEAHFNLGLMYSRVDSKAEVLKQIEVLERMKSPLAARLAHQIGQY
jgi:tetratricopeptide (TPR) repeat protein